MSDVVKKTGHCICSAVKVTANLQKSVGACHCGMCRRWSGGPFITVEGSDVQLDGKNNISIFNSSNWAERGFCKTCGSHLFYRLKQNNGSYFLPLGLFDDEQGLVFDHQIFVDCKSTIYDFANKTQNLTEAEVFAKFANKTD